MQYLTTPAGNCLASLGGVAGLNSRTVLLWLDAHADFNTPATSPSGFLDGMALSVITGRCHAELTSDLTGFAPLEDENLLMLGVRAVDEGEAALLQKVRRLRSSRELWHALAQTQPRDLYLHVDLDALDPSVVRANEFAAPHGLSLHTLHDVITTVKENKRIVALAITAYDPAYDVPDHGPQVVQDIIERVLA